MRSLALAASDSMVLARRNLLRIPRQPDLLIGFTLQPVMFVVLFVYVFGGAIRLPSFYDGYADFMLPGIIVQTMSFGGFVTALGLADDLGKGLIDRFRSLPMARSAVLVGRTVADIATNTISLAIMIAVGMLVGFSFGTGPLEIAAGLGLMLLFGFAFSWIFALIGMTVSSGEAANAVGFMVIFPLTFISSAFVPPETFPAALEAFAAVNPFTITVDAMRALFLGAPAGNNIWGAVAWSVGLILVFAPLAVRRYRRAVAS
ncbi:MAG: ABC transporter permease [Thermoleophilaceae bacterium]